MIRPTALVAVTVALLATLVPGPATAQSPAAAPVPVAAAPVPAAPMLSCGFPSTNSFGFTPWLSLVNMPTTVQRTTAYRKCSAPMFPNIREGHEHKTNFMNDDCTVLVATGGTATFNVTWNTTQQSTLTMSRFTSLTATTFTVSYSGTVTAGLFVGRPVRQVFTANATEINQCLANTGKVPFVISDVILNIY